MSPQSPEKKTAAPQPGAADEVVITDDLGLLLDTLPPRIRAALDKLGADNLLEIILDLGRRPEARFPGRAVDLDEAPVSAADLTYVVERIGAFDDDNRAGIERTLHRISALRNRRGAIIGLTCRVGRAVRGTVALIRDAVEAGRSLLILGRPGVGKTTLLREAARVLADELGKRVVVVDTSNEIAGDGDVPHPGIGRARRLQVARPAEQHRVMIEAVENHMPEVVVIDEIGTELEALAARTIAERGVQLVGTAHGRTLENLLANPTLADLVGGIQAVTLGDEEARRRGTQKTVLERKAPPTFDTLVEQEDRHLVGVHKDVAAAVDALLRGDAPVREMRERLSDGSLRRWTEHRAPRGAAADGVGLPARESPFERAEPSPRRTGRALAGQTTGDVWWSGGRGDGRSDGSGSGGERATSGAAGATVGQSPRQGRNLTEMTWLDPELARSAALLAERDELELMQSPEENPLTGRKRIYPMGINRGRLEQTIRELGVPAILTRDLRDADVLLVLKNIYRKQPDRVDAAQSAGIPVYVLRSSGSERLRETLADIFRSTLRAQAQHDASHDASADTDETADE